MLTRKEVNIMKIRMFLQISSAASIIVLASGPAFADSVTIDGTGQGSSSTIVVDNSTSVQASNTNDIALQNVSTQRATTGDVVTSSNTNAGAGNSGDSVNRNSTTSVLTITNGPVISGGSGNGGSSGGSGNGGSSGGSNGSSSGGSEGAGRGSGGSVLGASTGSSNVVPVLPGVGASQFVDVSALRALYHPAVLESPISQLAHRPAGISLSFLLIAGLISIAGAYGSAAFAERRSRRRGI
jgi:hypothetical protein